MALMPTDQITNLLTKFLDVQSRRAETVAGNLANADTPGYTARDLQPFAAMVGRSAAAPGSNPGSPARTQPGHLPGTRQSTPDVRPDTHVSERPASGNGVVLDEQLMKVADTETQHQLAMGVYRKYLGLFRTALGRGA